MKIPHRWILAFTSIAVITIFLVVHPGRVIGDSQTASLAGDNSLPVLTSATLPGDLLSGQNSLKSPSQESETDSGTLKLPRPNGNKALNSVFLLLLQEPQVSSLTITGAQLVGETQWAEYRCTANYIDGTFEDVTHSVSWSENSQYASVNSNGFLTTSNVPSDQTITITASYGGKTANYNVVIKNVTAYVSSLTISGPTQVSESTGAQYTCTANYSDGSTANVTSSALWNVFPQDYANIGATGYLTTSAVSSDQTCSISATYGMRTKSFNVTIKNASSVTQTTVIASTVNMLKSSDVYPNYANTVYANPSGTGVGVFWAYNAFLGLQDFIDNRTVLAFNIQSTIAGKTINRAILRLYPYELAGDFNTTYNVCALAGSWSPSTITWNNQPNVYSAVWKTVSPPTFLSAVLEVDVTDMVQYWANGTWGNYGFILYDSKFVFPYATLIRTTWFESLAYYTNANRRPQLYLEYR